MFYKVAYDNFVVSSSGILMHLKGKTDEYTLQALNWVYAMI